VGKEWNGMYLGECSILEDALVLAMYLCFFGISSQ
jgi:hypothetical protein